jgi:hypothetical protein
MARFLLHHRHAPSECGVAFAAWKGHPSPLRRHETFSSCRSGEHAIWWLVDATSAEDALALLPSIVAQRSAATEVSSVMIP